MVRFRTFRRRNHPRQLRGSTICGAGFSLPDFCHRLPTSQFIPGRSVAGSPIYLVVATFQDTGYLGSWQPNSQVLMRPRQQSWIGRYNRRITPNLQ